MILFNNFDNNFTVYSDKQCVRFVCSCPWETAAGRTLKVDFRTMILVIPQTVPSGSIALRTVSSLSMGIQCNPQIKGK